MKKTLIALAGIFTYGETEACKVQDLGKTTHTQDSCKYIVTFRISTVSILHMANLLVPGCISTEIDTTEKPCGNYFKINPYNNTLVLYLSKECSNPDIILRIYPKCKTLDSYLGSSTDSITGYPYRMFTELKYSINPCQEKHVPRNTAMACFSKDTVITVTSTDTIWINTLTEPDSIYAEYEQCRNVGTLYTVKTRNCMKIGNYLYNNPDNALPNTLTDKYRANCYLIPVSNYTYLYFTSKSNYSCVFVQ